MEVADDSVAPVGDEEDRDEGTCEAGIVSVETRQTDPEHDREQRERREEVMQPDVLPPAVHEEERRDAGQRQHDGVGLP